jgi:cytochrome c oxidase subunit II
MVSRWRHLVMIMLAAASMTACRHEGTHWMLDPAGPGSSSIAKLFYLMFWVMSIIFAIVVLMALVAAWKKRQPLTPELAVLSPESERRKSQIVMVSVALTVLILFVFLFASVRTGRDVLAIEQKEHVSIKVIGHQWWWEVQYENPQADQNLTTANEIHIPVNTPVVIKTSSMDVIHSFWVPALHGKRDLIPGQQSAFWIRADQEGTFRGQCAEFCGHQHAHMAVHVVVESKEKFESWLQSQLKPAPDPSAAVKRGHDVFVSSQCVMCHTIRGTIAGSRVGPDLTHIASRQNIAAGTLPNTRENLRKWITDPHTIKPGVRMTPNLLAPDDMNSLLDYLETLK